MNLKKCFVLLCIAFSSIQAPANQCIDLFQESYLSTLNNGWTNTVAMTQAATKILNDLLENCVTVAQSCRRNIGPIALTKIVLRTAKNVVGFDSNVEGFREQIMVKLASQIKKFKTSRGTEKADAGFELLTHLPEYIINLQRIALATMRGRGFTELTDTVVLTGTDGRTTTISNPGDAIMLVSKILIVEIYENRSSKDPLLKRMQTALLKVANSISVDTVRAIGLDVLLDALSTRDTENAESATDQS